MKDAIAFIPLIAITLTFCTSLATFYLFLSNAVRKRYAAERDFEHIKRNQESTRELLLAIDDDVKELKTELIRYMEKLK